MTGWEQALERLEPLHAQLDAVLAMGDVPAALRLAFQGAREAVRLIAEPASDQARMHCVYVELTPMTLAAHADGTLSEQRASVNLAYQCWDVAEEHAAQVAAQVGAQLTTNTSWAVDSS